jgi:hypothetical protein
VFRDGANLWRVLLHAAIVVTAATGRLATLGETLRSEVTRFLDQGRAA